MIYQDNLKAGPKTLKNGLVKKCHKYKLTFFRCWLTSGYAGPNETPNSGLGTTLSRNDASISSLFTGW